MKLLNLDKKSQMNSNGYLGNIELMRFIGILLIMGHHLYLIGYEGEYLFKNCWVWVDFYFMISGFFTAKHFRRNTVEIRNSEWAALSYTWNKFRRFLPFVVIAVTIQYFLVALPMFGSNDISGIISLYSNMPYEIMCLSSTGFVAAKLSPIWYLSAMLITLPIMVHIMIRHNEAWNILSVIFPIMYFGYMGVNTIRAWPNDFIRAFACMMLGSFACELPNMFKPKLNFGICSIFEITAILLAVYISVFNKPYINLIELLFFIIVLIMGTEKSISKYIGGVIINYMGKMSLPMFLLHWCVGTMVIYCSSDIRTRTLIYYIGTLLTAFISILLQKKWIAESKKKRGTDKYGS